MELILYILLGLLSLILVILFIYLIIGYYCYHYSLSRKGKFKKRIEKDYEKHLDKLEVDKSFWDSENIKKLIIKSQDSLDLVGYYLDNNSNKLVILVHGYGGNHFEVTNHAKLFSNLDYDILAIDLRAHGESEGDYLTLGLLESRDVLRWIDKMLEIKANYKIALFGLSMGASTVALVLGENPRNVVLAIEDSGYDNANKQLSFIYSKSKIKSKLIYKIFINYLLKTKNINLKNIDICEKLKKSKIPLLVLHGENDNFVPLEMAYNIYGSLPENLRSIEIFPNSGHVENFANNKSKYKITVKNFLNKYNM